MNILHTIGSLDPRSGGTTTAVVGMAEAQARAGLSVTVLAIFRPGFDGSAATKLRQAGVEVVLVGPVRSAWGGLGEHKARISSLIRDANVVHLHGTWDYTVQFVGTIAVQAGLPLVLTPHGMLDRYTLVEQGWAKKVKKQLYFPLFLKKVFRNAHVHFTAQGEADACGFKLNARGTIIEPLGLDLDQFAASDAGQAPPQWPEVAPDRIILFYGRIHPKKGCHLLVEAFALLNDSTLRLVFVGPEEPAYRQTLNEMIARSGIADRVHWCGMVGGDDRGWVLRHAGLFALPSQQENFGFTIFEAIASGLPVLISDRVNTHPEITRVQMGRVAERTPTGVAQAIEEMVADQALHQRVKAEGRRWLEEAFNWNAIGRNWVGHYQKLAR